MSQADVILRELRHQPDIKYGRLRRDANRASEAGRGKAWFYVGVKLKTSSGQSAT
jgi:hypothetical protein